MKRTILILGLLLFTSIPASAQSDLSNDMRSTGFISDRLDRIDAAINAEISAGKIPGGVALVIKDGEVAYLKSFGLADVDSQTPMQNDHIFRIASMTKAITSVAVMILYEQGHFQLNDSVGDYIPLFAEMTVVSAVDSDGNVSATEAATKPIKIIDLLTHTSGIGYPFIASSVQKSYVDAGIIDGVTARKMTLASQMEILAKQPLMFEPGSQFGYGLSTDLLGYLVEVISGQSLEQFFAEEIFAPLDMQDSYFYLPEKKAGRLATLYADGGERGLIVSKGDESSIILDDPLYPVAGARTYFSGGAGLSCTASDYGRFLQMLLNDGTLDGKRILGRKSVELMRAARVDWDGDEVPDMALGFQVIADIGEKGEIGSVGAYSWGGAFNTSYWIDPSEHLVGVFMSQVRPVDSDIRAKFSTAVYQALE